MSEAAEVVTIDVDYALGKAIRAASACGTPGDWAQIAMALHMTGRQATVVNKLEMVFSTGETHD